MNGVDLDDIKSQFKLEGRLCIILIFFTHFIKQTRFYWQFRRKCSTSLSIWKGMHNFVVKFWEEVGWTFFIFNQRCAGFWLVHCFMIHSLTLSQTRHLDEIVLMTKLNWDNIKVTTPTYKTRNLRQFNCKYQTKIFKIVMYCRDSLSSRQYKCSNYSL